MKPFISFTVILFALATVLGCSAEFWGGAGTGVLGTGAGYELRARQQIEQLEKDLEAGRITQEEFDIRKDQVERGSVVY